MVPGRPVLTAELFASRRFAIDPLKLPGDPVRTAARRYGALWTTPTIVAGALATIAVAAASVALLGHSFDVLDRDGFDRSSILARVAGFGLLVLTSSVVIGSIVGAFRSGNRNVLVRTVIAAYFSLMFVFASIYYIAAFFGDYQDAVFKYESYRADALHHVAGPRYTSRRAFAGIESRFWSGVDWPVRSGRFPNGLPPGAYEISTQQMRYIARSYPEDDVIQFLPEAQLAIFGDCLHLSVITMTTVGYGDIMPRSLEARFGTDIEAVCNTLLLIFGLGMIFGNIRPALDPAKPPQA